MEKDRRVRSGTESHALSRARGTPLVSARLAADDALDPELLQDAALCEADARHALENIQMVVVTRDLDGRLSFCNDYLLSVTGWEREAVLGRDWLEAFVPPESRVGDKWFLQRAREGWVDPHDETPILTRSGSQRLISWSHTLARDARGTAIGVTSIGLDVTDPRREEERLREAEVKYRNLVEQIPAVTYIDALDGCDTSYVSPQYEKVFGYSSEERTADPELWSKLLHPDDRELALGASDRSDKTGEPFKLEYRMIARDGQVVWVHDEAYLVENEAGERLFWQGVLFDITERMDREQRVREAEAKYRTLIEQIPAVTYIDAVSDDDPSDLIPVYISPQIADLVGYSPAQWIADEELWDRCVHPKDAQWVSSAGEEAHGRGVPFSAEYRIVTRDGRTAWVREASVPISDANGSPRFWQGVMFDVTELKRAEEELQQALKIEREASERLRQTDEMKNAFLTAVSHELRTPLAVILGTASTLERWEGLLQIEDRRDLVEGLATKARKLDELLSDLLDVDRLARGVLEPRRRRTDVSALVRRVVAESDSLGDHAVHIEADPVVVAVDPPMVERIVENLLANAARHTPPQTTVRVLVSRQDDGVLIAVEDEGSGVSEELKETIFEPFRQGPGVPAQSPGVGIGLSLVASFAELHGGRAWVQERLGGGASFRVLLPGGPAYEADSRASTPTH